jgi:hypothetical protein
MKIEVRVFDLDDSMLAYRYVNEIIKKEGSVFYDIPLEKQNSVHKLNVNGNHEEIISTNEYRDAEKMYIKCRKGGNSGEFFILVSFCSIIRMYSSEYDECTKADRLMTPNLWNSFEQGISYLM